MTKLPKLTKEQAIVLSAYTGVLLCNLKDMQAEIEKRVGRSLFTHELGDVHFVRDVVRPAFKEDVLSMVPD